MDRAKEMMEFLKRGNKFNGAKSFVWIPAMAWKLGAREAGWFDWKEKKLSSRVHSATIPLTTEMEMKHWGRKGEQAWEKVFAQLCSDSGSQNWQLKQSPVGYNLSCWGSKDLSSYPSPLFSDGCTENFKLVKRSSRRLNLKVKQHIHLVTALWHKRVSIVWIFPFHFPVND